MIVRLLAATALALFLVGLALGHVTARASRSSATVIPASSFHDVVGHPQESRNPWPTTRTPSILEPDLSTPVPRAAVEQPAAAPLTVSKAPVAGGITGTASYYDWRPGEAAACAPLRAALGSGWRGRVVSVNGIAVRLTDYCPQEGRVIDLDSRTFALLAPLSQGLVSVRVAL